jgi:hypothetical protein
MPTWGDALLAPGFYVAGPLALNCTVSFDFEAIITPRTNSFVWFFEDSWEFRLYAASHESVKALMYAAPAEGGTNGFVRTCAKVRSSAFTRRKLKKNHSGCVNTA